MSCTSLYQKLFLVEIRRFLIIIAVAIVIAVSFQCFLLPYKKSFPLSVVDHENSISRALLTSNRTISHGFDLSPDNVSSIGKNGSNSSSIDEEIEDEEELPLNVDFVHDENGSFPLAAAGENGTVSSLSAVNVTSADNISKTAKTQPKISVSITFNRRNGSSSSLKRGEGPLVSISQMNRLLLQSHSSSNYLSPRRSSVRDNALRSAKFKIENAPIVRNYPGLDVSVFRNLSRFKRSYELMERTLKIYIYKEGEKPIFHQAKMRGIYASEGWFMKLLEGNKKFVVKDPEKAHLFFLPFSPHMLRTVLYGQTLHSHRELEGYLKKYVNLVARKYSFWNRTGGADHFLIGCHDWAARMTRKHMKNSIRVLCNADVSKGFKIGKDTTLPVTYIRSAERPLQDLGGKPPSERPILAFFAGGMHGYLRPILLHHWENKEPDMKIIGPMPRDIEGKRLYREYMKSSKYCICARGYEVHTPRIVEAILYGCVPVIISDNYVPPFFEVMNWEAFSVFVEEKDVGNLRDILVSIPEEKYVEMYGRVMRVQQHFMWHKVPVKYDLFHMILHSVWYNRVFQM